ncbi:MAG: hypothetical protein L6365_05625 [Desulfobulbaceae bacterium]|nr:hypothetical protein [Pseudomonadota bacterium]MCG2746992.1 hypothetical protein [Desulfobulbaceae bacterium]
MAQSFSTKSPAQKTQKDRIVPRSIHTVQKKSTTEASQATPLYLSLTASSPMPAVQCQKEDAQTHPPAPVLHHSPPSTGPGSRSEPLVAGDGVQRVADMATDAYYRSPLNPENPVLVWTNGTQLFFAPAEAQIAAGRTTSTPEPEFSPPPGYVAEELHWDRRTGLTTGGGPLVIIARQAGQPDLEVTISNTLAQRAYFISGEAMEVSREGTEFMRVYDSSVPLALSGAATEGPIHRVSFADGFMRFRAPGGDHDLYVARGANPDVYLVERATGAIAEHYASGSIAAIIPATTGVVSLERTASFLGIPVPTTINIDLRASPPAISSGLGFRSAEAGYAAAKTSLQALDVRIEELGVRMRVAELEAIENTLILGSNRGLNALIAFRTLEGLTTSDPILEVSKSLGPSAGSGLAASGGGIPLLTYSEPFERRSIEQVATLRHEMTHIIMGAIDAVNRSRLTATERANLEGAMRYEAQGAREKAQAGELRQGEYGAGDVVPAAGTLASWRSTVDEDPELAAIWVELLRRYRFIADPEGTGEFRGASLADESRYLGVAENTGHPADSVGEFVSSFVTSATLFRGPFSRAILDAETAGNARGGSGGTYLRGLYRRAWILIDGKYVPLGSNPF